MRLLCDCCATAARLLRDCYVIGLRVAIWQVHEDVPLQKEFANLPILGRSNQRGCLIRQA